MSLIPCINAAEEAGLLSKTRASELRAQFLAEAERNQKRGMGRAEAERSAAAETLDQHDRAAKKRALDLERQAEIRDHLLEEAWTRRNSKGIVDGPETWFREIQEADVTQRLYFSMFARRIGRFLQQTQPISPGMPLFKNAATRWERVMREKMRPQVGGKKTGDAEAAEIARLLDEIDRDYVRLANEMGADIKFMEGHAPVIHSAKKIAKAGPERWVATMMARTDRARMISRTTKAAFTDEEYRAFLDSEYDRILAGGVDLETAGQLRQGFVSKLERERTFHWKSFEDYAAYQREFGEGNAYAAVTQDIAGMARELALLQHFGRNPDATYRWMHDMMELWRQDFARGRPSPFPERGAAGRPHKDQGHRYLAGKKAAMDRVWRLLRRHYLKPADPLVAQIYANSDNIGTSAALWATTALSTPGDFFQAVTVRHLNKIMDVRFPIIGELHAVMKQAVAVGDQLAREEARLAAMDALVVQDEMMHSMGEIVRGVMDMHGSGVSQRTPAFAFKETMLLQMTQAERNAVGVDLGPWAARLRGQGWADLDPDIRLSMEEANLNAADWDAIRSSPTATDRFGRETLGPESVLANRALGPLEARRRAAKFYNLIDYLVERSTATGTIKARSFTSVRTVAPGTAGHILLQSALRLRTFSAQMMTTWHRDVFARFWRDGRLTPGRGMLGLARVLTPFAVYGALAGAASIQFINLMQGRDPEPMDERFWVRAMIKGGGFSLAGDFAFASVNSRGQGPLEYFTGPPIAFATAFAGLAGVDLAIQALWDIAVEDEASDKRWEEYRHKHAARAAKFAKQWIPLVNGWPTNLIWDKTIVDTIHEWADPEGFKASRDRQIEQVGRTSRFQGERSYYWPPGSPLPERAPSTSPPPR